MQFFSEYPSGTVVSLNKTLVIKLLSGKLFLRLCRAALLKILVGKHELKLFSYKRGV